MHYQAISLVISSCFSLWEISINIGNIIMIKVEDILQYSTVNSPQFVLSWQTGEGLIILNISRKDWMFARQLSIDCFQSIVLDCWRENTESWLQVIKFHTVPFLNPDEAPLKSSLPKGIC